MIVNHNPMEMQLLKSVFNRDWIYGFIIDSQSVFGLDDNVHGKNIYSYNCIYLVKINWGTTD